MRSAAVVMRAMTFPVKSARVVLRASSLQHHDVARAPMLRPFVMRAGLRW